MDFFFRFFFLTHKNLESVIVFILHNSTVPLPEKVALKLKLQLRNVPQEREAWTIFHGQSRILRKNFSNVLILQQSIVLLLVLPDTVTAVGV